MSIDDADAALRIVEAGRRRVHARLRDAFARQIAGHPELGEIDPDVLERSVSESADRASSSLWRIALAEGAVDEYGVGIGDALAHPAVRAAEQLIGPPAEPVPLDADTALPAEALQAIPEPVREEPMPDAWAEPAPAADPAAEVPDGWGGPEDAEAPAETSEPDVAPEAEPGVAPEAEPDVATEAEPEPAVDGWGEPLPTAEPGAPAPAPAAAAAPALPPSFPPEPERAPEQPLPAPEPPPARAPAAPSAIRIAAVHTDGIETLKSGEKDIELRLSDAGLDVIKASTGIAIGRLEWREITDVEITGAKRGLRRRAPALEVRTARGQASFELPKLTEQERSEHLQPMLDRLRESGALAAE